MHKKKEWWWSLVPLAGRNKYWTTIGGTIYVPPKDYDENLTSLSVVNFARYIHEKTHVDQFKLYGWKFFFKYLFSREKRAIYESMAYGRQAAVFFYLTRKDFSDTWYEKRVNRIFGYPYFTFYSKEGIKNCIDLGGGLYLGELNGGEDSAK